jgi:hypothetical protein
MSSVTASNSGGNPQRYETWHRTSSRGSFAFEISAAAAAGGITTFVGLAATDFATTSLQQHRLGVVTAAVAGIAVATGAAKLLLHVPAAPPPVTFTPPATEQIDVAAIDGAPGSNGSLSGERAGTVSTDASAGATSQGDFTYQNQLGRKDGYASEADALDAYGTADAGAGNPETSIAIVKSAGRYLVYELNTEQLEQAIPETAGGTQLEFVVDDNVTAIQFAHSLYRAETPGKLVFSETAHTIPARSDRDRKLLEKLGFWDGPGVAHIDVPLVGDADLYPEWSKFFDLGLGFPDLSEASAAMQQLPPDSRAAVVHSRDRYFVVGLETGENTLFKGSAIEKMTAPESQDVVPEMWLNGKVWYPDDGLWVTKAGDS